MSRIDGKKVIVGVVDSEVLTKHEKTQLMSRPKESFYHHYQRPQNNKVLNKVNQEWNHGESKKLFDIMPEVIPMEIGAKFEDAVRNFSVVSQEQYSQPGLPIMSKLSMKVQGQLKQMFDNI